jgi:DNA-binding MarR family transcriptional regulator
MPTPAQAPGTVTLDGRELGAWRGFLRTHREIVSVLDEELQRTHDLPLSSYEVLLLLCESPRGRMRMGDLAEGLLLSRSGLTRLVDRLERRGLVERVRCEEDARGLFAQITPRGREVFQAARPDHLDGVRRHFLSRLEDAELDTLAGIWRHLVDEPGPQPAPRISP